jgi:transposase
MQKIRKPRAKYTPEFKLSVIIDMRENNLGYHETVRKYNLGNPETGGARKMLHNWERIYLEEGAADLYVERRGRKTKMDNPKKGRPRKKSLDKEIENDLIAESQHLKERNEYLEMENEYLKKLDALVRAEAQQNGKKRK